MASLESRLRQLEGGTVPGGAVELAHELLDVQIAALLLRADPVRAAEVMAECEAETWPA